MSGHNIKRHFLTAIIVILLVIAFAILTFSFSFDFSGRVKEDNCKYEYVMRDVFADKDPKVVDIAMLGAHDAFSSGINYTSAVNKNEGGIITNKFVSFIAKGFISRMTKAQKANAMQMLMSGVRYLDVRVTKVGGVYYTAHGLISNTLEFYLKDVVDFLGTHPGELVVFDIQHFMYMKNQNGNDTDEYRQLFKFIKSIRNDQGKNLFDYTFYDGISLSNLTYSTATNSRTSAGVIILAKTHAFPQVYFRDGDATKNVPDNTQNIRSYWHQTNSFEELRKGINEEAAFVKDNVADNVFTVNQAQLTGFVEDAKLVRSVFLWSLLDMAANTNEKLVKDKDSFMSNIKEMKIFMVDNATSAKGDFVNLVNQYIREANEQLSK